MFSVLDHLFFFSLLENLLTVEQRTAVEDEEERAAAHAFSLAG